MAQSPQSAFAQDDLRKSPAGAWAAVLVLSVLYALAFLDRQIVSLLVAPIKHDLKVTDVQIGLLQGLSFALLYSACGLPLGLAVDRLSRRLVIFGGVFTWALAAAACGLARNFPELLATRFFVGMGEAALAPAAYSILSDLFHQRRLTFALAVYTLGAQVGAAASLVIGAQVVHWAGAGVVLPILGPVAVWQAAFLATGAPGLALAFLAFLIKEPRRSGHSPAAQGSFTELFALVRSQPGFFAAHLIGFSCVMMLAYANLAWVPTFLARTYHWPTSRVGPILALFNLSTGVVSLLLSGRVVDFLFSRGMQDAHFRFYAFASIAMGISGALAFNAPTPLLFFGLLIVSALALNMAAVAASAIQIVTPAALRGRASALYLMVVSLAAITLGPLSVGWISDKVLHDESRIGAALALTFLIISPIACATFALGLKPMRAAVEMARGRKFG